VKRETINACRILEILLFKSAYIADLKGSNTIVRQGLDWSVYVCEANRTE
jgi:hypothetical protein